MSKKKIDTEKEIQKHLEAVQKLLGIKITESNKDTPKRVARMYCDELFRNRNDAHLEELDEKITMFPKEGSTLPIVVRDIPFSSTCEHHWLPFMGKVTVRYTPNEKIIGLSKIPRVVKYFSKRPQLQERLTSDIGKYLVDKLDPISLEVIIVSTHTCVMCRGAESDCETETRFEYRVEKRS